MVNSTRTARQTGSVPPTFTVARNPDGDSSLPYLIRFTVDGRDVVLKAREPWPRTAKVYCHRADGWPATAEVVEEVGVRSCERRGPAVDLVLARARENRSQLVFVRGKDGREMIFWQTARTTKMARPGLRVPTRRASGWPELPVVVDTRERYAYKFSGQQVALERRALRAGDYGVEAGGELIAVVERKSLADLSARLIDGSLTYNLADLSTLWRAAVVVEDRYSDVFKLERVKDGFVPDLLARL
ncbi:MAG TPA: ERCC4 domain-containing protein [Acidimicrobiales bacterium]